MSVRGEPTVFFLFLHFAKQTAALLAWAIEKGYVRINTPDNVLRGAKIFVIQIFRESQQTVWKRTKQQRPTHFYWLPIALTPSCHRFQLRYLLVFNYLDRHDRYSHIMCVVVVETVRKVKSFLLNSFSCARVFRFVLRSFNMNSHPHPPPNDSTFTHSLSFTSSKIVARVQRILQSSPPRLFSCQVIRKWSRFSLLGALWLCRIYNNYWDVQGTVYLEAAVTTEPTL